MFPFFGFVFFFKEKTQVIIVDSTICKNLRAGFCKKKKTKLKARKEEEEEEEKKSQSVNK